MNDEMQVPLKLSHILRQQNKRIKRQHEKLLVKELDRHWLKQYNADMKTRAAQLK